MNQKALLVALVAVVCAAQAQAQTIIFDNILNSSGASNFAGAAIAGGTATGGLSRMQATKITPISGGQLTKIKFAVYNANTTSQSVRANLRFYSSDGASGGPGTIFAAVAFNASTFAAGVTLLSADLTTLNITLPSTSFWAGLCFDNNSNATGATDAALTNFGMGLFLQPGAVGTADNQTFRSSSAGSFLANGPAGTFSSFTNTGGANIVGGWQMETVPEPASMIALAAGAAFLARRRRKN